MRSKLKRLLGESVIYGLGGVLSRFISFFLLPFYTRVFTPDDYGVMEIISTLFYMVSGLLIMGTDSALAYYFSKADTESEKKEYISSLILFELCIAAVSATALVLAAPKVGNFVFSAGDQSGSAYIRLAAFSLAQSMIVSQTQFVLRLERRALTFISLSVGSLVMTASITIFLVVGLRIGLWGVYLSKVITDSFVMIIGLWAIRKWLKFEIVGARVRQLLSYGLPLVPATIAIWITANADRYFLEHYTGGASVGLYSVSNRLASAMSLIVSSFQLGWTPFSFSVHRDENARQTYARVLVLFSGVVCYAATGLSLLSPYILRILTPPAYHGAWLSVPLLAFAIVLNGCYHVFSVGVNVMGKTKYVSVTTAIAATTNLALNFLLIPRLGPIGAAVATIVAQLISAITLYFVAQRTYHIPYDLTLVGAVFCLNLMAAAVGYAWTETTLAIVVGKMALLLLIPVLYVKLGVVSLKEVKSVLRL